MNLFQMLERSARSINGERPAVTFEGDERSFAAVARHATRTEQQNTLRSTD